jgi:acetoin utilization deacetylase AcuC-like enzyme
VLVVDTDVHQGDGTAAIFAGDDSVFTFSIHGDANFPATKATSDLDIALPTGTGDAEYLAALQRGLDACFERGRPGFAFYLSGADPHEGDRLGKLAVTKHGLRERDRMVFAALRARGVPWVTVMGGGYGKRIEDTVDVYEATVDEALRG